MLGSRTGQGFGALIALSVAFAAGTTVDIAQARTRLDRVSAHAVASTYAGRFHYIGRYAHRGLLRHWASILQCVPFARENSGIELTGNAGTWWNNAEGLYERGARPEVGSILNFRASGRMRMGHVAVVTNVVDNRHIEIDHANWSGAGRISRDIDVVDVSPENDWTAVRVALSQSEHDFGSTYPTYGFIYDRPDTGVMTANSGTVTLGAHTSPESNDPAALPTDPEEVAEAADDPASRSYAYHRHVARYRFSARMRQHGHFAFHGVPAYRVISRYTFASTHHNRRF